jgi:hypothetical protein
MYKHLTEKERKQIGKRLKDEREQEDRLLERAGITRRNLRYKQKIYQKLSQNRRYNIRFASLIDEFRFKPIK